MKNIFTDEFLKELNEHQKKLDELSANMIKAMKELSTLGWYISGKTEILSIAKLAAEIKSGHLENIDETMRSYYNSEFDSTIQNLKNLYPERDKIFTEAANAHKQNMYFASTTLFLAQADGICKGHLYITKNEKKNLKKEISKFNNPILAEVLDVIANVSAIDAPYSNGFKYPSKLNRHVVIHGLDIEFGTETNSLKAFSLLSFIGDFFDRYKKRNKENTIASKSIAASGADILQQQ